MKTLSFLIFTFILISINMQGQDWDYQQPDYKSIESNISNESGNFFYGTLMSQFNSGDTSLSNEEIRHLYYGYSFQSGYSPYGHSKYNDSVRGVLNKDVLEENDYAKLNAFCEGVLADNPFDLRMLEYKIFASKNLGLAGEQELRIKQINWIIDAIISSGNGLESETAFYVINTSDEYFMLSVFGFEFGGEQSLIGNCDYLKVTENETEIEGLYFNIEPCLNHLNKMFKE